PLVRNAAGKLFVEAKLEIELRIEGPERFGHQPGAPVGILFADHLHFGTPAPARPVIVPFNLILADVSEDAGANQVTSGNLIGRAAPCRSIFDWRRRRARGCESTSRKRPRPPHFLCL